MLNFTSTRSVNGDYFILRSVGAR